MIKKSLFVALVGALFSSTSAQALTQEANWMLGRWNCTIAGQKSVMTWSYPLVACARENCRNISSVLTKPKGMWRGKAQTYMGGSDTQFLFSDGVPNSFVWTMKKDGPNRFSGGLPLGEYGYLLECNRDLSPKGQVFGGVAGAVR